MYFGHEDGFPGAPRQGRNLHRTLDVIGTEKKRGTAIRGAQAKGRKVVGGGVFSHAAVRLRLIMTGRISRTGRTGSRLLFEKPPHLSVYACLCRSLCLCVMRLRDGRTIRCHP